MCKTLTTVNVRLYRYHLDNWKVAHKIKILSYHPSSVASCDT